MILAKYYFHLHLMLDITLKGFVNMKRDNVYVLLYFMRANILKLIKIIKDKYNENFCELMLHNTSQ